MNKRYDFGRNWSEFADGVDQSHLDQATKKLQVLAGDLEGRSFLDIGCGSGLHSAAALALGVTKLHALDYDRDSVATTRRVLERFFPKRSWVVERADALDPATLPQETFDLVYSWGVLHHTGDMWSAIRNASQRVALNGRFCIALYLKTPMCEAWKVEKRIYAQNRWLRPLIKWPYIAAFLIRRQMVSRDALAHVKNYGEGRGMNFYTDADDWLGGYPYESVVPAELERFMSDLGFVLEASFDTEAGRGFFGTRCGEWRFVRSA